MAELTKAMTPFVDGNAGGLSRALCTDLYRLQTAYRDGPRRQQEVLARLAVMDPDRLKIPDTAGCAPP